MEFVNEIILILNNLSCGGCVIRSDFLFKVIDSSFPRPVTLSETNLTEFPHVDCLLWHENTYFIHLFRISDKWLKDFFGWGLGVDFFGILAYKSDLPPNDLWTFSQNLKQLQIVSIHVNIVFHSSWLFLGILAWGKCYHCQLDSNFMPTAQL